MKCLLDFPSRGLLFFFFWHTGVLLYSALVNAMTLGSSLDRFCPT